MISSCEKQSSVTSSAYFYWVSVHLTLVLMLYEADVVQKLHETIRDNVDRESGPLPAHTFPGWWEFREVRQSESSDPGGGGGGAETVSRQAGKGTGQRAGN